MKFIRLIATAFINTMGITQPSPEATNRAAWFIVIMLAAVITAVATVALVAVSWASITELQAPGYNLHSPPKSLSTRRLDGV